MLFDGTYSTTDLIPILDCVLLCLKDSDSATKTIANELHESDHVDLSTPEEIIHFLEKKSIEGRTSAMQVAYFTVFSGDDYKYI